MLCFLTGGHPAGSQPGNVNPKARMKKEGERMKVNKHKINPLKIRSIEIL